MQELNFHRDDLDGRNRCMSEFNWKTSDGSYIRCELENEHTLVHAGRGLTWNDDQERKGPFMNRWLADLVRFTGLAVALVAYGLLTSYTTDPGTPVSLWFLIVSLIVLAGIFACCTGIIITDIKDKIKKDHHG